MKSQIQRFKSQGFKSPAFAMQFAVVMFLTSLIPQMAHAADLTDGQSDQGQSVEANLREMDKDRNGLVTVTEVRAYLEAKHGKGYEKALLDKLEQTSGASCGTAFANSFY